MKRKKALPKHLPLRRAVMVLHERVEKLEKAIERQKRPIGFDVEVRGDVIEQDEDDPEIPEET